MTTLVPFTESALRQATHEALWGSSRDEGRGFSQDLVDAIFAEADVVGDLFSPERGYLTTDDQIEKITGRAVQEILYAVRSTIERTFINGLQRVPPPEFVPPRRGSWVAERRHWRKGIEVGTWHRSTGRTEQVRQERAWPRLVPSCGYRLMAWWNDDGSPQVDWLVVDDEPIGACGRCRQLPLRERVPA